MSLNHRKHLLAAAVSCAASLGAGSAGSQTAQPSTNASSQSSTTATATATASIFGAPVARKPAIDAPSPSVAPTPARSLVPRANYSIAATDTSIRGAFERWARQNKTEVRWMLGDVDIPVDAPGVIPRAPNPADFNASRFPELVEAMTVVATALSNNRHPFVIRERDNVILILPRIGARQ